MKRTLIVAVFLLGAAGLFAQQAVGDPDPTQIDPDTAQQELKEVSIEKFEKDGYWVARMSQDDGYVTARLFEGAPAGKEPIPDEADLERPDQYVLGVKVDFLRRSHTNFTVMPIRPIPVEGITKTVSVWAVGRNYNHQLYLMVEDFFGRSFELYMGNLNFQGWKQLTVAIPSQGDDDMTGIVQRNTHYQNEAGLKIRGFRVVIDPADAVGSYYLYLDDLRAVTDLFTENNRDPDDMEDAW